MRSRKCLREQDGKAAASGAQVERTFNARRADDPWREPLAQQFGDERARHDHALVDIKAEITQPGFMRQVSSGNTAAYAFIDQAQCARALRRSEFARKNRRQLVQRQPQCVQYQIDRFIPRIGGAMPVAEPCAFEPCMGVREQCADSNGNR